VVAPATQETLAAEALGEVIARHPSVGSPIVLRGLRDRCELDVDHVVIRAAVAVGRLAIGAFGACRTVPKDPLNEGCGFKKTSGTREPSGLDQVDRYSFIQHDDVPSQD